MAFTEVVFMARAVLAGVLFVATILVSPSDAHDIRECKVDAVFVVDNSASITYMNGPRLNMENWDLVVNFTEHLAKGLNISAEGSHVGLIDFHNTGQIHFGLLDHTTEADASAAILSLKYKGFSTNTPAGIRLGREVLTDNQYGPRDGVPKIMFIITDGEPTDKWLHLLNDEIQKTKTAQIRMIAIGVTSDVSMVTLKKLASTRSDYHIARSFDDLQAIKDSIMNNETCTTPPDIDSLPSLSENISTMAPQTPSSSESSTEKPKFIEYKNAVASSDDVTTLPSLSKILSAISPLTSPDSGFTRDESALLKDDDATSQVTTPSDRQTLEIQSLQRKKMMKMRKMMNEDC